MSSGLDSTAAFLHLINNNNLNNDLIFPCYVWWRKKTTKAIQREFKNSKKIIKYIRKKYNEREIMICNLMKIQIPLLFYEEIRQEFINVGRNNYWPHFRNAFFILGSLSYLLNFLKLNNIEEYDKIAIVTGFIGTVVDENKMFINDMERLINNPLQDKSLKEISNVIENIEKLEFYCPYISDETRYHPYFDIEKYGDEEILKYTWSCYRNKKKPCKSCGGCEDRIEKYNTYRSSGGSLKDPIYI